MGRGGGLQEVEEERRRNVKKSLLGPENTVKCLHAFLYVKESRPCDTIGLAQRKRVGLIIL